MIGIPNSPNHPSHHPEPYTTGKVVEMAHGPCCYNPDIKLCIADVSSSVYINLCIPDGSTFYMRSNLELFILALVEKGLTTPYQLMTKAGISLGSSLPALRRLREAELISQSKTMARGAKKFTILPAGRKALVEGLKNQLSSHPTDLESMLRIACLASMNGSERDYRRVLNESAASLRSQSKRAMAEATELASRMSDRNRGENFRWLRVHLEAHRLQAEAQALESLSMRKNARNKLKNKGHRKSTQRAKR